MKCPLKRVKSNQSSHESPYQFVYDDKTAAGDLGRCRRCQKSYCKRYGSGRERRG
jgi:hypothetical protein